MNKKSLLKVALSALLIVVILRFVDLHEVGRTLRSASLPYVALVVGLYIAGQLMSACKWWLLARAGGVHATFLTALRAYYIGMYVNCFGLGMVGGDVARGFLLAGSKEDRATALASVVADRVHGLAVLSYIGVFSVLIFGAPMHSDVLLTTLLSCSAGITFLWFFGPWCVEALLPQSKFKTQVERILTAFPRSLPALGVISAISAAIHLLQISLHLLMGLAIGVYLPWRVIYSVIPLVNILSSLPISWNGLGVRETSYKYFLSPHLLTPEQAVAFGALWLLAVTVSSSVGGVIAFLTNDLARLKRSRAAEVESQTAESQATTA